MRVSLMAALAACLLAAPACKSEEKKAETPPATAPAETPPATTPPAETPPADTAAADTMLNDMKNCPNAVAGAETKVSLDKGAINMTITAKDAAATTEIRTRSHALLHGDKAAGGDVKHTGQGTGGGGLGKCPAMVAGAKTEVADVEGGVKVTYTSDDPAKLPQWGTQIEERVKAMPSAPAGQTEGAAPAGGAAPAPATK